MLHNLLGVRVRVRVRVSRVMIRVSIRVRVRFSFCSFGFIRSGVRSWPNGVRVRVRRSLRV